MAIAITLRSVSSLSQSASSLWSKIIVNDSYRWNKLKTVSTIDSYRFTIRGPLLILIKSYRSGNIGILIASDSYRSDMMTIMIMYNTVTGTY
jgi:hypothetical protein